MGGGFGVLGLSCCDYLGSPFFERRSMLWAVRSVVHQLPILHSFRDVARVSVEILRKFDVLSNSGT